MRQKSVKAGTLLINKDTGDLWKVVARNYNEVIMKHLNCSEHTREWEVFEWDFVNENWEIYGRKRTTKVLN